MTHGERLLIKLLFILVPITIVWCFVVVQQDHWDEIKTQKANTALAELVDRVNREADTRYAAEPKEVRLWRAVYRSAGVNNAGNIRGRDGEFVSYSSPAKGVQALRNDIIAKVTGNSRMMKAKLGDDYIPTIKNIIRVYAPPHENDTARYIDFVAKNSGIHPDKRLSITDVNKLLPHIIKKEKGHQEAANYIKYIRN